MPKAISIYSRKERQAGRGTARPSEGRGRRGASPAPVCCTWGRRCLKVARGSTSSARKEGPEGHTGFLGEAGRPLPDGARRLAWRRPCAEEFPPDGGLKAPNALREEPSSNRRCLKQSMPRTFEQPEGARVPRHAGADGRGGRSALCRRHVPWEVAPSKPPTQRDTGTPAGVSQTTGPPAAGRSRSGLAYERRGRSRT